MQRQVLKGGWSHLCLVTSWDWCPGWTEATRLQPSLYTSGSWVCLYWQQLVPAGGLAPGRHCNPGILAIRKQWRHHLAFTTPHTTQQQQKNKNNQKPTHMVFDFLWTGQGTFLVQDFHRPNGAKILRFGNFPETLTYLGSLENCQKSKSFSKIWLWNCGTFAIIFWPAKIFFLKKFKKM